MPNIRSLICTSCPIGCPITVELTEDGKDVISVKGNSCKRGDIYARAECTHPERMVCSTVKVNGGRLPVVPVKTSAPIPKEKIFEVMKEINKVSVKAPVNIGDIVLKNILKLGVDIVATNND